MKGKLVVGAGIAALLALTFSIVTAASATPKRHHDVRLHLFQPANTDQITEIDANQNGKFDTGDYVVDDGPLYNAAGTHREGSFRSIFTVVDKGQLAARTIFRLHKGDITSDGVIEENQTTVHVAITGGTKRYEAAAGEIKAVLGGNGATNFYFELVRLGRD